MVSLFLPQKWWLFTHRSTHSFFLKLMITFFRHPPTDYRHLLRLSSWSTVQCSCKFIHKKLLRLSLGYHSPGWCHSGRPAPSVENKTKNLTVVYFWSVVFETNRGVSVVDGPVSESRCEASTEASVAVDGRATERHQGWCVFQQTSHPPASDVRQTVNLVRVIHGVRACLRWPQRVVEVETCGRPFRIRLHSTDSIK